MTNFVKIVILAFVFNYSGITGKSDIYTRSIKCYNVNPDFYKLNQCRLKAERGRKGVIYGNGTILNPIEYPLVNLRLFWRGSSQRFQPYLINVELKTCEISKYKNSTSKFVNVVKGMATNLCPELVAAAMKGCPIQPMDLTVKIDADKDIKPWLPPIIPEGIFKAYLHFHEGNVTIIDIDVIVEVKTLGISDFIKLG